MSAIRLVENAGHVLLFAAFAVASALTWLLLVQAGAGVAAQLTGWMHP